LVEEAILVGENNNLYFVPGKIAENSRELVGSLRIKVIEAKRLLAADTLGTN
jgi:hypothetical protein